MAVPIDLSGHVVLVCGTARGGIGGATARLLAAAGAEVVAVDHSQALLDETIADVEALGGRCTGIEADILVPESSARIFEAIAKSPGRLDAVVNVVGGTQPQHWGPLETSPYEHFDEVLDFNLRYVFRICRDAANFMIERRTQGCIVNTASLTAGLSAPSHGFYGASKAAVVALTRTMAAEWGAKGIRANSVSPGAVLTQRLRDRMAEESTPDLSAFSSPEQIANVMLFLVSDLSSGISGRDIVVDSGFSAKHSARP